MTTSYDAVGVDVFKTTSDPAIESNIVDKVCTARTTVIARQIAVAMTLAELGPEALIAAASQAAIPADLEQLMALRFGCLDRALVGFNEATDDAESIVAAAKTIETYVRTGAEA